MKSFEDSIDINAPAELCYQCWRHFSCLSLFMNDIKRVEQLSENRYRWVLEGEYGDVAAWELILVKDIPASFISWRTAEGPDIDMWIDVHFIKVRPDLTHLHIEFTFTPMESPNGQLLMNLYAVSPSNVKQNLELFRDWIEAAYKNQQPVLEALQAHTIPAVRKL